jgi:hypothetical protein
VRHILLCGVVWCGAVSCRVVCVAVCCIKLGWVGLGFSFFHTSNLFHTLDSIVNYTVIFLSHSSFLPRIICHPSSVSLSLSLLISSSPLPPSIPHLTGVFRAVQRRVNPRIRSVKGVYKTYIDAIHFRLASSEDSVRTTEGYVCCTCLL